MSRGQSIFEDRELVEMLIREPELLAVAEALVTTTPLVDSRGSTSAPSSWRRSRRFGLLGALAAAVAVVFGLVLVSPWAGRPTLAESALAAIGNGPVLHVVVSQPAPAAERFVDVTSGHTTQPMLQTEIWFDRSRDLKKTVFKMNGSVVDEQLETKAGGWTRTGPIYTCDWIAAHPLEAAKVRVSCDVAANQAGSRDVPELDPALSGFVDGYQLALASGRATELGSGTVDDRNVIWLQFETNGILERVAIDAETRKPVLVKRGSEQSTIHVLEASTTNYDADLFAKPKTVTTQAGGSVTTQTSVTTERAAAILGQHALWLGETWNDLRLVGITHETRTVSYGHREEPGHADTIKLTYARIANDGSIRPHSRIDIYEANTCLVSVGWTCTPRDPTAPGIFVARGPISLLQTQGLYVSIWSSLSDPRSRPLEIARALTPATPIR